MITLGLTGSIGMGKSTTAQLFADAGVFLWDADAAVHRLYDVGGAGVSAIAAIAPGAIKNESVDRAALRLAIMADSLLLKRVEALVHPLVAEDRAQALEKAKTTGHDIAVLDIPLIFEKGAQDDFDRIIVVSAPADVQRARVLARPGMTPAIFETILSKQMPDAQKRALADHVIDTGKGIECARAQVNDLVALIRDEFGNA